MLFSIALLLAAPAGLQQALQQVDASEFEDAIPVLRELLYPPTVNGDDLRRARIGLARALFYTSKQEGARVELRHLFKKFPRASLDAARTPPDFLAFFDEAREEFAPRVAPARAKPASAPSMVVAPSNTLPFGPAPMEVVQPRAPSFAALAPAANEKAPLPPKARAPWYARMWPLGIGHFINHDYAAGAVFLGLEVALIAANAALVVLNGNAVLASGEYRNGTGPGLYIGQQVTAGAAYLTVAVDVIHGLVWSSP